DHSLQPPQGLAALVSAAIPHQRKREAVFRGDRDSLEQRRKDVRRGDEIGVPGPAPLQIEQQGRELIRRDGHRSPPFEGELPGLAALAGEIAAGDQHQAGGHELRLLAVVDPGPGEPEPVALLADAGRPARAIDTAEVRAEIAAGVMRAGLRGAVVQIARREPHTGLTCPRGTTSRAPPETQRSCPMQCEDASLESHSAAFTTSSTSATRRLGSVGIRAGPMRCSDSSAIGVRTQPGETRLTLTRGASSTAMDIII